METKILGDRNNIAIEYTPVDSSEKIARAECKIWLGGRYLGDEGSTIYLDSFRSSLRGLLGMKEFEFSLPSSIRTPDDLLHLMEDPAPYDIFRNYFIPIGGFDDFLKLVYFKGGEYVFFTSIHPQAIADGRYAGYPQDVQQVRISIESLRRVVEEFEAAITHRPDAAPE